ncbi:hypothetical protein AC578_6678 [Pseudocercospora eumusae]|uniref:Carbohydrate kinase PfkB domain-containing protein n=1 Tax=Pseudocercospora eumusae TaxID=321146 RepID=A0A139HHY1_9PEZI|nr:hypothetical protein AC578_6678 [Pseudocercospora eumusae]
MTAHTFIALGGVWLDEIRSAGKVKFQDILGGSVTFATLGARLFEADSRTIRLIVTAGHDFPSDAVEILRSWNVDLSIHWRENIPHARGIAHYGKSESERYYQRVTAPINTDSSYLSISETINTECFHFFETPEALTENVKAILKVRFYMPNEDPLVIWEPQAKSMTPASLDLHCATAKLVDAFSPNHRELAAFFENTAKDSHEFERQIVESQASHFLNDGIGSDGKGCIVVRCAEHGCLIMSRDVGPRWLPAYHTDQEKVINTTGAGNAFLGAFAIGLLETNNIVKAAMYGQVASSFMIEQAGVPKLSKDSEDELWNGVKARGRLAEYEQKLSQINEDEK